MQPANTASASEIEGRSGSRAVVVGMSWVRSREMAPYPSVIPAFKLNPRPHSEATSFVEWMRCRLLSIEVPPRYIGVRTFLRTKRDNTSRIDS